MRISRFKQLARVAWGFHKYLKRPLTLQKALDDIKIRMDNRERNFLGIAKQLIYENQYSPYRKLLLWAGCRYGDLEDSVRYKGVEKTLDKLRDEGVYLTLEEFKSKIPVYRQGLTIEAGERDFDNPFLMGKAIEGSTSASRSRGIRVMYDWDFLTEEAANELILCEIHGLSNVPLALWLPGLPAISGIHNLLMNVKFRKPPERWFSHLGAETSQPSLKDRLFLEYIFWYCRRFGLSVPKPKFTTINNALKVAEWMGKTRRNKGTCTVRTYTSSAVRIARSAVEKDIEIAGCTIFTGGEPLTEMRRRFIESSGVKVFPRYVATETGLIGASCGNGSYPDDMHVYLDRLAIIQRDRKTVIRGHDINSFLFTSLSLNAGKILLNTEIGDFGSLTVRPCRCLFGEMGMNVHIRNVRSHDKLTGEGMTLLGSDLDDIVGKLIEKAGGSPDDYQFRESHDSGGLSKLIIAINPEIKNLNEEDFIDAVMKGLRNKSPGSTITSQLWEQAGTFRVVRAYPEMTMGNKMMPIIKDPGGPEQ
jgi:hypothetical protein